MGQALGGRGPSAYCGHLGKTENCQVAVRFSLATEVGSITLAYRLYLPQEWTRDKKRCQVAGVPKEVGFATKGPIAWAQIEQALAAGIPRGTVLMDAGYGEAVDGDARSAQLSAHGALLRGGGAPGDHGVVGETQARSRNAKAPPGGRPRTRVRRTARHQPIGVLDLAGALPRASWRTIEWREGTNTPLASRRFARVRCRTTHGDRPRAEEWLLIEWPQGDAAPTHYFLSNLPEAVSLEDLVTTVKMRWRIGRRATSSSSKNSASGITKDATGAAFVVTRESVYRRLRLSDARTALGRTKKTPLDYKRLPYPKASARAGLGPLQRHVPWSIATIRHRLACAIARTTSAMPMLREIVSAGSA